MQEQNQSTQSLPMQSQSTDSRQIGGPDRLSELEGRVVMLENAIRLNSQNSDAHKVREIVAFLSAKLGFVPEAAKPADPLAS